MSYEIRLIVKRQPRKQCGSFFPITLSKHFLSLKDIKFDTQQVDRILPPSLHPHLHNMRISLSERENCCVGFLLILAKHSNSTPVRFCEEIYNSFNHKNPVGKFPRTTHPPFFRLVLSQHLLAVSVLFFVFPF